MKKYSKLLLSKINDYKANKISREALSDWASNELSSFLENGEIIEYEKFEIYPFISELAIRKESFEFLSDNIIEEYKEVLNGSRSMTYECYMKIPQNKHRNPIKNIIRIIDNYKGRGMMSNNDLDEVENLVEKCVEMEIKTFLDFLYFDIVRMVAELPITNNSEPRISSIFVPEMEFDSHIIEDRLLKTIECYNGDRVFRVNMLYPVINISVC